MELTTLFICLKTTHFVAFNFENAALLVIQGLVPDGAWLNGAPCKRYLDTRPLAAIPTAEAALSKIQQQIINSSSSGGHISKEDIVSTGIPGVTQPSPSSGNSPISAKDGLLYGTDGNPVVLQVILSASDHACCLALSHLYM